MFSSPHVPRRWYKKPLQEASLEAPGEAPDINSRNTFRPDVLELAWS